jgi:hypothetical protein
MKSITTHSLIVCLILMVSYLPPVSAVTDAELEALEKQIEQQEAEEKYKLEAEAIRKAELKRKSEEEAKKKKEQGESKSKAVEAAEIKRLNELENKQIEAAAIRKAEVKKRTREENYNKQIKIAAAYLEEDKFNLAIKEYELLLESFPGDAQAIEGLEEANNLQNACNEIVGTWAMQPAGRTWVLHENNTAYGSWLIFHADGLWECLSAREREFRTSWPDCAVCGTEYLILSDDGNTLMRSRNSGSTGRRIVNSKEGVKPQKQSPIDL